MEKREIWRKLVVKSSCAPTTLVVKGLTMMMMVAINLFELMPCAAFVCILMLVYMCCVTWEA